jgi:hypothetical protein
VIKIQDNFLCEENVLDDLYTFFHYAGSWQFDFFTDNYVWSKKHASATEHKICQIIRKLTELEPRFAGKGYEVWVNVMDSDNHCLAHHIDCDEEADGIEPAKATAVIHLGGDLLEGGELIVDTGGYHRDYKFEGDIYKLQERAQAAGWLSIDYRPNRLIIFDSNYPHAVLPIKHNNPGTSRVSLMISSWDKKIKVNR